MEALINTMAKTLLERKARTLHKTIGNVEAESRVNTQGDAEVEAVLNALAKNLAEAKVKTFGDTPGDTSADTLA